MIDRNSKYEGNEFNSAIKQDVQIARELGYSSRVVEMINKEPSPIRRQNILHDARLGKIR